MKQAPLTMVSVKYGSSAFLTRNAALVRALNPAAPYEWIVVNNDNDEKFASSEFRVLPGVPRPSDPKDRGSAHHAAAIMAALQHVSSRFVLLLDHDFFVVKPDWVQSLLEHVTEKKIAFFGSVWHPRWSYQPRGFPSVHFMLIDLEQVDRSALDFRPDMNGNRLDAIISHPNLPLPQGLRTLLQMGAFRDTGWRVRERFINSGLRAECLVPHVNIKEARRDAEPLHRFVAQVLPRVRNPIPRADEITDGSFLRADSLVGYALGWEEFFWRDAPFGFHLRSVGRRITDSETDLAELDRLLELYSISRS
jgi:Glycosyl transferase family 2